MNRGTFPERAGLTRVLAQPILLVDIVLLVVLSIEAGGFLSPTNIQSLLAQTAIVGIGAAGMTLLITAGAFDLSVSGTVAIAACVVAKVSTSDGGVLAIVLAVLAGAGAGLLNGTLITKARVTAFVATLGTLSVFLSVAYVWTNGQSFIVTSAALLNLGTGSVGGYVPYGFIVMIGVYAAAYVLLRRTRYGRYLRAVGSNPSAAQYAGIRVTRVVVTTFVVAGVAAAIAGVLLAGLLSTANGDMATNYNLTTIAVTVIGGTSLAGGEANLFGTVLGSLFYAMISDGLTLLGVNSYWQYVATGVVLIVALTRGRAQLFAWGRSALAGATRPSLGDELPSPAAPSEPGVGV